MEIKIYSYPSSIPAFIKNQSVAFQKEFIKRFNDCYSTLEKAGHKGDDLDNRARICAWSRMKADGWRKGKEDKWEKKVISPMYLTFKIAKIDEAKRRVYGYATTEDIDFEDEIIEKQAIEKALLDFAERATMREMHQRWAVGKFHVLETDEKGLWVSGEVVDDAAWKKVATGVYRWFSIGFKILDEAVEKGINHVKELLLFEISIVDVGCNLATHMEFATKSAGDKGIIWFDDLDNREEVTMKEGGKTWVITQEMIKELGNDCFALVNDNGRFIPHHDKEGKFHSEACTNGIDILNGGKKAVGGPDIMEKITEAERKKIYKHLKAHLKEEKESVPPLIDLESGKAIEEGEKTENKTDQPDVAKTIGQKMVDFGKSLLGIGPDTSTKKLSGIDFVENFEVNQAQSNLSTVFRTLDDTVWRILCRDDFDGPEKIPVIEKAFEDAKSTYVSLYETILNAFKGIGSLIEDTKSIFTHPENPPMMKGKWDGSAAEKRVRKWASKDDSGDKDQMNWDKYKQGFGYYDSENPEDFGAYKLLHHDIEDGTLKVHEGGVIAAGNVLMGARGGVDISEADQNRAKIHLARHYSQFDRTAPWNKKFLEMLGIDYKVGAKLSKARVAALKQVVTALSELIAEATEGNEKTTKGGSAMKEVKHEGDNVTVITEDGAEKKFVFDSKTGAMTPADKPAEGENGAGATAGTEAKTDEKVLGEIKDSLKALTDNLTALTKKMDDGAKAMDTAIATAVDKAEKSITEKMEKIENRVAVIEKIEGKSIQGDGETSEKTRNSAFKLKKV